MTTEDGGNIEYHISGVTEPEEDAELALRELPPHPPHPVPKPGHWMKTDGYGESVAMYRVGGYEYPMVTVLTCKTCTAHPKVRVFIENALINSVPYAQIERSLPDEYGVPWRSIRNHMDKLHMPLQQYIRRQIIEKRAIDIGLDVAHHDGTLVNYLSLGDSVIHEVYRRMMEGNIKPDMKDAVAFARLIKASEEKVGEELDQEIIYETFLVYQEAVRRNVDEETFRIIAHEITSSPVIRGYIDKQDRIEDAEWEDQPTVEMTEEELSILRSGDNLIED